MASAIALAEAGAQVTILGRHADTLLPILGQLPTPIDQSHNFMAIDQNDLKLLDNLLAAYVQTGPVHIWVNNTGGPKGGPLHQADPAALEAAFRQHVLAAQVMLARLLPGMRQAGYGRIINVISTSVKQPIPGLGVSNTIRAAMANWAKTLAGELASDGITVNNILPGFTDTDRLKEIIEAKAKTLGSTTEEVASTMQASVPAGRFADPSETAAAIAFLASPAAAYINGINMPVDGGRTQSL
jgi:3-oxoacyl-[acyl-carrier protein] reductase